MASSTASSSSPSARAPSPSPSPRSMRFGGGGSSRSHSSVLPPQQASTSFLPVPTAAAAGGGTLHIPHSQADLDRLLMERQLDELSLMSSSRASSSFVSRSSTHPQHPTHTQHHQHHADDDRSQAASHDDYGSSVEFARGASPGGNLSLRGGGGASSVQSSFNTTTAPADGHAPSPVSTTGHHASAITLRTGLVGSGIPHFRGHGPSGGAAGFDDERELGKMLGGTTTTGAGGVPSRAFSFGLSDLGFPTTNDNHGGAYSNAPTPRAAKPRKLTDALSRSFSPAGPRASHHARVPSPLAPRAQREGTEESLFTTLARGVEDQLLRPSSAQRGQPLQSQASPAQDAAYDTSGAVRRATSAGSGGGKKKRASQGAGPPRSRAVSGGYAGGGNHQSLYLPDVTGLSEAVGETPLRAVRRSGGVQEGREEANPYPLQELQTLQARLRALDAENTTSRRRVAQLEDELRLTREREAAARDEWALERGVLRANAGAGQSGEGEWERRYYEVLEEKKALEDLVASLRAQVQKLQTDLQTQQAVVAELQAARQADQAELARRGQEVDRLRDEVRQLSAEVGGLKRAFEGRERERREEGTQTSPREWGGEEDRRAPAGLGFDVGDDDDDRAAVERDERREQQRAEVEDGRRSARASPVERPASRLSDGLRMAAATHTSPPLPSSPRMADVLPPPSPRPRSHFSTAAAAGGSRPSSRQQTQMQKQQPVLPPLPPSPHAWAASFEHEEPVLDLDAADADADDRHRGPDLVDLNDDGPAAADETIQPQSRTRTTSAEHRAPAAEADRARSASPPADGTDRLPAQTVLARVLRELEDDYAHYKAIFAELADQYKALDAAANVAKRNVLAEHLREVVDTLEQKGDQIAALYSLLSFGDRPLPPPKPSATAHERKAFKSVRDLLRAVGSGGGGGQGHGQR